MKKRNKQLVLGLGAVSVLGVGLALANTPPATLYGPPSGEVISTENPAAEESTAEVGTTEITEAEDTGSTAAETAEDSAEEKRPEDIDIQGAEIPECLYGPPSYFGLDSEEESDSGTGVTEE